MLGDKRWPALSASGAAEYLLVLVLVVVTRGVKVSVAHRRTPLVTAPATAAKRARQPVQKRARQQCRHRAEGCAVSIVPPTLPQRL